MARKLTILQREEIRCSLILGCPVQIIGDDRSRYCAVEIHHPSGLIKSRIDVLQVRPDMHYTVGAQLDEICHSVKQRELNV